MKDSTLLLIAVISGLIGLTALYLISERIDPEEFENLQRHEEGEVVELEGSVKDIIKTEDVTIMEVETLKTVEVVAFEPLDLKEEQRVEITGEIDEYEGERQIVAEEIK